MPEFACNLTCFALEGESVVSCRPAMIKAHEVLPTCFVYTNFDRKGLPVSSSLDLYSYCIEIRYLFSPLFHLLGIKPTAFLQASSPLSLQGTQNPWLPLQEPPLQKMIIRYCQLTIFGLFIFSYLNIIVPTCPRKKAHRNKLSLVSLAYFTPLVARRFYPWSSIKEIDKTNLLSTEVISRSSCASSKTCRSGRGY